MEEESLKLLQGKVTLLRNEGKYKKAIEAGYYLLNCGRENDDYKSVLTAYINIAVSYYYVGDMEKAFANIDLYKEICNKRGDDSDKLSLYNTLFVLYEYKKDFYKAKQTLKKSIELGEKLKQYNILSNGYSNYSHILISESNYLEALKMAEKGLEMAKLHKPKNKMLELRVTLNIALSHIKLKNFDLSERLIKKIIEDPILDSFLREKAQVNILQGKWYSNQQLYLEAFHSLTNAKDIVESYDDLYLLKQIQEERCKMCELMGDITLGYSVQKEYIAILNEVSKRELDIAALKLDIKYNITSIEKKANIDYLTGVYNRSYLEKTTNDWLNEASIKEKSIVCIAFDIDNFKNINDKYGHLTGDDVMREISKTCSTVIRENDLIARYGGDEFVIILKESSLEFGKEIARRIKRKLGELNIIRDKEKLDISASIGVADSLEGSIQTFEELFSLADIRLYKAKQNGRNRIYAV